MRRIVVVIALLWTATACATSDEPSSAPASTPAARIPAKSPPSGPPTPARPRGEAAPDFSVTTFDGERFSLGEQRGTPVVLNFWESW